MNNVLLKRKERREFRQRGSAKRNILVDDFTIDADKVNKKRIPNKLDLGIVKQETIENINQNPLLESLPSNSLNIGNNNRLYFDKYGTNEPFDGYHDEYIDYSKTDELDNELDNFSTKDKDFKGNNEQSSSVETNTNLKNPRLFNTVAIDNKKRKGKLDGLDSVYDSKSNSKKRVLGKEFSAVRDNKVRTSPVRTRNLRSRKIVITEPIPLTKTKLKQKQKPLLVDMKRLIYEEKSDKRHKIHTLDVIKHFIKNFEPRSESGLKLLNEEILHSDFKIHLVNNLDNLMDIIASSNDILNRFTEVQKQKNNLRSKVYEIRKEHSEIGNKLNALRMKYAASRRTCNEFNNIQKELDELNSKLTSFSSDEKDGGSNINTSYININALKNLMHSKLGLKSRMAYINDILQQLNDKL